MARFVRQAEHLKPKKVREILAKVVKIFERWHSKGIEKVDHQAVVTQLRRALHAKSSEGIGYAGFRYTLAVI